MNQNKIVAVLGPTASGKTEMAVRLCEKLNGEAVSCDSMQIYRRMDIGTAKPTQEEKRGIAHHMLDVCDPEEDYSVARYVAEADRCVQDILSRGKIPVLVGGTGLYADSLIRGIGFLKRQEDMSLRAELTARYENEGGEALLSELARVDPASAARLHTNDARRIIRALEVYALTGKTLTEHDEETRKQPPRYEALRLVLCPDPRELLYERIEQRVDKMIAEGLFEEVKNLLDGGLSPNCTAMQAIGYKEIYSYLTNKYSKEEARNAVILNTRHYAKRQLTWFKRGPHTDVLWKNLCEYSKKTEENLARCMIFFGFDEDYKNAKKNEIGDCIL